MGPGDYILPVDKPVGPTSHDVVAMARRALGTRKIGHTGTLDPFASGLLVLSIGKATRLAEYLTRLEKIYVAEARLGITTDTLDREGEVVAENDGWHILDRTSIEDCFAGFVGAIDQVPPQFSAKKVDGEAMHRRARRGESVILKPVPITIHALELLTVELPAVTFSVRCSTGTYVRALARDMGEALGVGAHLTTLRRTTVGRFHVEDAVPADALDSDERVTAARVAPVDAMGHFPRVDVGSDDAGRVRHGQRVRVGGVDENDGLVTVAHDGDLVAVARFEGGVLKPAKVFPA